MTSMFHLTPDLLAEYSLNDNILSLLNSQKSGPIKGLTCDQWIRDSLPKRFIFSQLYGDLLSASDKPSSLIDVGGGITSLTPLLCDSTRYTLIDLLSHDSIDTFNHTCEGTSLDIIIADWASVLPNHKADLIIANDIFPNVDQRLPIFLEQALPNCATLRLSLTWYHQPRYYCVRRVDAEETMYVMSWDWSQLANQLTKYASRIKDFSPTGLPSSVPSSYPNGRHVTIVELRGDLPHDHDPR